ncbi:hypothetical protein FOZ61_001082 [Perkinsus olseni]|uniref:Uncharacterized protein n=1 Tax=Perkinsus olseni TaxID=32597 RepID=A0A7J6LXY1_PEROL|nr:hypothetical protein FOZ61_001082 [Perkinsus olseni]
MIRHVLKMSSYSNNRGTNILLLVGEVDTPLDINLQLVDDLLNSAGLVLAQALDGMNLGDTLRSEVAQVREELSLSIGLVEVDGSRSLLAVHATENNISELGSGVSHGEGGRSGTGLGVDNIGTGVLDVVVQSGKSGHIEVSLGGGVREPGHDGDTSVTTNNRDGDLVDVGLHLLGDEGLGPDGIQKRDTEELLGVEDTGLLVDLSAGGNNGVNGVGDDAHGSVGGVLGAVLGETLGDASVDREEIISGHTGLTRDTGGDDDNITTSKASLDLLLTGVTLNLSGGVDVAQILGNTGARSTGLLDIVKSQLRDLLVELQKKSERLSDTTASTEKSDLDSHDVVERIQRRRG